MDALKISVPHNAIEEMSRRQLEIERSHKTTRSVSVIPIGQDPERDKKIREGWLRNQKSN